ncbi:MAG: gamma carbonic anhydrase family protein [Oscillospiraceae bacterium]
MKQKTTDAAVWIAETAVVTGDVTFGTESSVWHGAVLRGDCGKLTIGSRTNIQDGVTLHETVTLGDGCTIGHGAIVHGCAVGDNSLIGMGAIVLDGAVIGRDCIVGAGALVTGRTVIPDGSMVLGSPARVIRPLRPEEIEGNRASAAEYVKLTREARESE